MEAVEISQGQRSSYRPNGLRSRLRKRRLGVGVILAGLVCLGILILLSACGEVTSKGGMEAEATVLPGGADITNLNDFPWYGLMITLNEKYSNRLLMDKGNWPYFRHDSVVMPSEVEKIVFESNFVDSDDNYLDSDDTWWENIPYTITVENIRLEAKSKIDGPYDLMVTLTTSDRNR